MDSHALPQNRGPLPQPENADLLNRERAKQEQSQGFKIVPFAKEVVKRFGEDNSSLVAAALSFFTLVSLVPVLLIAVWVLGNILRSANAQEQAVNLLSGFLPALAESANIREQLYNFLNGLVSGPKTTVGIIGILGLVWSASALFLNMETALNAVLGVTAKRSFVKARLAAIATMLLLGLLLLSSIVITSVMNIIEGYRIPIANFSPGDLPFVFDIIGFLLPIAMTLALFFAIYKIIPYAKIDKRAALVGAAFSTVFFELAKHGFGWYVSNFGNFDKTYGALGVIVFLVTWILYSYTIMLLGAEVADVYSDSVLCKPVVDEQAKDGEPQKPMKVAG